MPVFEFYKKRDFNTYIGDTIQFLKQFGKDFFKNYIIINGALLLVVCVIYYFMFKNMGNLFSINGFNENWFLTQNNLMLFGGFASLSLLIFIAYGIFSVAYPIVYMRLVESTGRNSFTASELLDGIKQSAGRIFAFGLISIFVLIPILIIVMIICFALCFILIGIPLLIAFIGFATVWSMQAMYAFVYDKEDYFSALGKGWKTAFSSFWSIIGATCVTVLCIGILGSVFNIIPSMMSMASVYSTGAEANPFVKTPLMIAIYIFSTIFSYLLYNIAYVQQGLIYFSAKEASDNYQAYSEIDSIGNDQN